MNTLKAYAPYILVVALYTIDSAFRLFPQGSNIIGLLLMATLTGDLLRTCVFPSNNPRYKVILVLILFYITLNNAGTLSNYIK